MPKSIHIVGSGVNTSMVSTTEDDVLIGKIFIDNKGNEAIGRIPDRSFAPDGVSPQTRNLDAGQTLDFDYGYYNHQFSIEANSLASQTVADAVASHILVNKTAWVNGNKIVGTMPDRAAVNSALNCGGSYTIPAGYHNGSGKITANSLASQTSATAQASHILVNKTAWVNGSKVTGIMTDRAAVTSALNCGGSYTIPAGYHNGSGKITANSLASQTSATAVAGDILSGKTAWVNGNKITGSIGSLGATTYTPGTSDKTIAAGKYLSGIQTIKGDSNLKSEYIMSGVNIFGVSGSIRLEKNKGIIYDNVLDYTQKTYLPHNKIYVLQPNSYYLITAIVAFGDENDAEVQSKKLIWVNPSSSQDNKGTILFSTSGESDDYVVIRYSTTYEDGVYYFNIDSKKGNLSLTGGKYPTKLVLSLFVYAKYYK